MLLQYASSFHGEYEKCLDFIFSSISKRFKVGGHWFEEDSKEWFCSCLKEFGLHGSVNLGVLSNVKVYTAVAVRKRKISHSTFTQFLRFSWWD